MLLLAAMLLAVSGPRPAVAAPLQYYEIKRLILPVIRRSGLEGHITLKVLLELYDVSIRPEVKGKMLFLRDDFILLLFQRLLALLFLPLPSFLQYLQYQPVSLPGSAHQFSSR